jgi:phage repressor protein C with HTH and peptisase S24 domain
VSRKNFAKNHTGAIKMTFSKRFQEVITASDFEKSVFKKSGKLNYSEIARNIGVDSATVQRILEENNKPSFDVLCRIAEFYNADLNWLLLGRRMEKIKDDGGNLPGEDFIYVPMVSGALAAGRPLAADNAIELKIAFRREWMARKGDPKNMSLIRIQGDSMEPTLLSGDVVLIDHSKNVVSSQGGIYAIALEGEIMIKRVEYLVSKKVVVVKSDNPRYTAEEIPPEKLTVNGKMVWFAREVER